MPVQKEKLAQYKRAQDEYDKFEQDTKLKHKLKTITSLKPSQV